MSAIQQNRYIRYRIAVTVPGYFQVFIHPNLGSYPDSFVNITSISVTVSGLLLQLYDIKIIKHKKKLSFKN